MFINLFTHQIFPNAHYAPGAVQGGAGSGRDNQAQLSLPEIYNLWRYKLSEKGINSSKEIK